MFSPPFSVHEMIFNPFNINNKEITVANVQLLLNKYGIFARIGNKGWTIEQIKMWCDKNNIYYENTDERKDLVERINDAGYK